MGAEQSLYFRVRNRWRSGIQVNIQRMSMKGCVTRLIILALTWIHDF